ncbi:SDR family NAD(P)-dependent oxidoreductase [Calidithermus chliarophilus]|uniref:SDR family NAD(P)-dependent oxidoreductase n=1 Tax=Calidithermus chliarophilus TaxID=52023 RepID=UPI00041DC243|nr:SDR family oxidoreductase [Calidithermus chliarophilus]
MNGNTKKTALITGASGGIGEALARELAPKGYDLILVARSAGKLEVLGRELAQKHGITCHALAVDLATPQAAGEVVKGLGARGLQVDVLVNNAGFADFGDFAHSDPLKQQQMIQLNVGTLTLLTRALLPQMLERRWGRVLNVASTAAFMPGPLMSVYYASKAYVLSFSEAIAEELEGSGVSVTALCPGPVETGFQSRAEMQGSKLLRQRFNPLMDAATVAREAVAAMERGQRVLIPGLMNQLQALAPRFLPRGLMPSFVKNAQARSQ